MPIELKDRRTIQSGKSLLLTLPPEWWRHHCLMARTSIKIVISDDGSLILKPGPVTIPPNGEENDANKIDET
mgnify:CR=1 FL=1